MRSRSISTSLLKSSLSVFSALSRNVVLPTPGGPYTRITELGSDSRTAAINSSRAANSQGCLPCKLESGQALSSKALSEARKESLPACAHSLASSEFTVDFEFIDRGLCAAIRLFSGFHRIRPGRAWRFDSLDRATAAKGTILEPP